MRRLCIHLTLMVGALACSLTPALALSPDTTDPVAIAKAVEDLPELDRMTAQMKMLIKDSSGSKRERVVRTSAMNFDDSRKQMILFVSPADVRNTGLLTVDYKASTKTDGQWLYLPALRKSTRIASSAKSGSFMGSDLSFADMTSQVIDDYSHTMIDPNAKVGGEACWKIEAVPKTKKAKDETGYLKSVMWISKEKLAPLQVKHFVRAGKKTKLMKFANYKKLGGLWFAHKIMAQTRQGNKALSTTMLSFQNVKFDDASISDSEFSQRRLERGL